MWIVLGAGAIIFAALNVIWMLRSKSAKWFRFISLSLTVLTICAFYADGASRVLNNDLSGLMDIMPTMSKMLWVGSIASILINAISLIKESK